jgi:hypothetical protein
MWTPQYTHSNAFATYNHPWDLTEVNSNILSSEYWS